MGHFVYGFLSGAVLTLWYQHFNLMEFVENLGLCILIITVGGFFIHNSLKYTFNIVSHWRKHKLKNNINYECLLISGAWGLGKTRYYEDNYQDNGALPDIYISCFSATKNDLLARIINQNWLWKILLLNGILVKLFENNWQQFMPKNRTIVLDDPDRLHSADENYLDIIGIIDFLKLNKKCKIILIADTSKIPQILNVYLERIVDEVAIWQPCEIKDLLNDSNYTNFTKQMANYLTYYPGEHLSNRRIVKNILKQLDSFSNNNTLLNDKDSLIVNIFLGLIAPQVNTLIKLRYVYFYDYQWFCSLVHEIHDKYMSMKIIPNEIKPHPCIGNPAIISMGGVSFGLTYLEIKDQEKCRIYKINNYDIDIIVKIYPTCVNKDYLQLEREWWNRCSTRYLNNNIYCS
ncbi:MAG: hypothetical protein K2P99_05845 [Burkholderiales bacterium]|nr:hypothetical protein [Burkholderiales bacterium]